MASFVGWALRRDPPSSPSSSSPSPSIPAINNNNNNNNDSNQSISPPSTTTIITPSAPPPSYYPSIIPSAPSECDIEKMRTENCRLRAVLEMIKKNKNRSEGGEIEEKKKEKEKIDNIDGYSFEHLGSVPGANGFLLSIPSAPPSVLPSNNNNSNNNNNNNNTPLWTLLPPESKPIPINPFIIPSNNNTTSSSSSSSSSLLSPSSINNNNNNNNNININKSDGEVLLTPDDASTVIVKSEAEGEVALLDLSEIDWYVMVNNDGTTNDNNNNINNDNTNNHTGKIRAKVDRRGKYTGLSDDKIVDSETLGEDDDGYLLIDHDDYIIALSDFISRSIQKKFPEAEQIPPEQLRKILGTAFKPLQPPSKFGKAIGWANFLYHSYSWGQTAFTIYREGVYAKLVLRGAMKAAQWLLVLVL